MGSSDKLLTNSNLTADIVINTAKKHETPFYIYDEQMIIDNCNELLNMPNAYGIIVNYAVKANSNKALLQLINDQSLSFDASSLNEAKRINSANIPLNRIMLTTQEVPEGKDRIDLEKMIKNGLKYNVCSLRQLYLIADFAVLNRVKLSFRVHPGVGSGESATRNTGDKYSCFGIHLSDIKKALDFAKSKNLIFEEVHVHIGSGADPVVWKDNIDRELSFVEKYFPDAKYINFGGGLKVARMPDEKRADIASLGNYAKKKIEDFYKRTGRKLIMKIEPGTYVVANVGFLVTKVIDIKQTGVEGFTFIVTNGGMEVNARPLLYGSKHPFYIISKEGKVISNEFDLKQFDMEDDQRVIVGRCCESGDSQCLDDTGHIVPRVMGMPDMEDYIVVGGCGAYCSAMTPFNYNSHYQAAELLLRKNGKDVDLIRKRQLFKQIFQNELNLRKVK
ncbi:MAG: diaminopimelate decarboxylase [Spirochaetes bacterium]|nr:diaminopimelate decarboxylase [Spirochaetota bacterium]